MRSLKVGILAADFDQRELQSQVEASGLTRVVFCTSALPRSVQESAFQQLHDAKPDVILIDIPPEADPALACIEFLHLQFPETLLVPVGDTTKPKVIVSAMRAGAGEFLERPVSASQLQQAFSRMAKHLDRRGGERAKLFCFVNAKGGSGATTAAVNTALALANKDLPVVLIELASPGGAGLQLNVNPKFTLADTFRSFGRLDFSLLEGMLTDCGEGLYLLAGSEEPVPPPRSEDIAHFMDVLASNFCYVVIDASSRLDELTRVTCEFSDQVVMVAQPDVSSLWAASKVRKYVGGGADKKVGLVLNRYRKMPGLDDLQIEQAVGCKLIWTIQNQYISISRSIENGTPVARDGRSEIARAFTGLAQVLAGERPPENKAAEKPVRASVFEKLVTSRTFSFSG